MAVVLVSPTLSASALILINNTEDKLNNSRSLSFSGFHVRTARGSVAKEAIKNRIDMKIGTGIVAVPSLISVELEPHKILAINRARTGSKVFCFVMTVLVLY